jgi:hypothetical protein
MARRVLYLLNISNPDRLTSDSGWIFADLLTSALVDAGAEVIVAAPAPVGDARCGFQCTGVPATKYRARFAPDLDQLAALIRRTQPDVVIANQIEVAPAVRAAMLETGSPALLAGYCHYLPFSFIDGQVRLDPSLNDAGLGRSALLVFAAGLAACERVLLHSQAAACWTRVAARRMNVDVGSKLRVVPAPRDERLVRDPTDVPTPREFAVGIYNHRLYAHYGTARFTGLARRLTTEAPVRVRVMDLFGARRTERAALDDSPERHRAELAALPDVEIVSDRNDRIRYRTLLAEAHFGIAPFRPGCPWSMSVIDCQGMSLPVIAPRLGWLANHVDPELLFDTDDEALALVRRLATDREFYLVHARRAHASTAALRPALVADRYLEAIS